MIGIILIVAAVAVFLGYFLCKPKTEPQQKVTGTGVVEQVHGADTGSAQYTVRFTGARNRSFLAKTGRYSGKTGKYADGKLVHIRYWFDKKGRPGVEILDEELIKVAEKSKNGSRWCLILSPVLLVLGILLLVL